MIRGFQHVGLSVSSLERAVDFYRRALEMEPVNQGIRFEPGYADGQYEEILGLPGAAGRAVLIATAGLKLELFEFSYPTAKRSDPRRPVSDCGITHFCIEVDDIDAQCQRISSAGGWLHCPALNFFGKVRATYARDLDGNVFELVESL